MPYVENLVRQYEMTLPCTKCGAALVVRVDVVGETQTPDVIGFEGESVAKCHACSADVSWQPCVSVYNGDAKLVSASGFGPANG